MFRDFEHGAWEDAEVHLWHKADSLSGLAARPLLGVKRTLPVMVVHGLGSGPIN